VQFSRLRAGVCLGAELGALSARARGFLVSGEGPGFWRAGRLDVEGRWALASGIDVELSLSAVAPLERHEFVVDEFRPGFVSAWYSQSTLYRPQPVVARAGIGLSIAFGRGD
jgi:hypothetical protein